MCIILSKLCRKDDEFSYKNAIKDQNLIKLDDSSLNVFGDGIILTATIVRE
jgi:hypothetical protein